MTTDVTTKILEQIRSDIQAVRDDVRVVRDDVRVVRDDVGALDARVTTMEYTLRGMATHVAQIPDIVRLMRQVADTVAEHEDRISRLES